MKNLFKFVPVALALAAFSSCSNEDGLFGLGSKSEKNALSVTVEDPADLTRAVREGVSTSAAKFHWQYGDQISVYDANLHKYDIYQYNAAADAFLLEGASKLDKPAEYALFPRQDVKRAYWDQNELTGEEYVTAEMNVPREIYYDQYSEEFLANGIGYVSNLPMWGEVTNVAGGLSTKLSNLCGVLVINVKNVLMNKPWIVLHSETHALSGTFKAILDPNDVESVVLEEGDTDLKTYNDMFIDLTSVPSQVSVIYVPVIAGVDDLRVYTANSSFDWITAYGFVPTIEQLEQYIAANPTFDYEANATTDPATDVTKPLEKIGDYSTMKPFSRNGFRQLQASFDIAAKTPKQLSELLKLYKNTNQPALTLELTEFEINGATDGSNTIEIPEGFTADLNIILPATVTEGGDNRLFITDASSDTYWDVPSGGTYLPANPYDGRICLDVTNRGVSNPTFVFVAANEATVDLYGTFSTVNIEGQYLVGTDQIPGSAEVTISGQAAMVNLGSCESITFGDGLTGTLIKDFTLLPVVTAQAPIDVFTVSEKANVKHLTAGGLDLRDPVASAATGRPQVKINNFIVDGVFATPTGVNPLITSVATLEIGGDGFIQADVTAAGKTVVARATEGEAIAGQLTLDGAGMTLELVQGYIPTINVNVNTMLGTWQAKTATIKLDNEDQGNVAFLALNVLPENDVTVTESTWNGEKISTVWDKYCNVFTDFTYGTTAHDPAAIFTATQLSSKHINAPGSGATLRNDIDLQGYDWVGMGLYGTFNGEDPVLIKDDENRPQIHIIKNLHLKDKTSSNGLFKNTSTGSDPVIKNLIINGVTATYTDNVSSIGALVGLTADFLTIDNVAVTGLSIVGASKKTLDTVGGLVGGVTVKGTNISNSFVEGTIDGYHSLGGLIGSTNRNIVITNTTANVSFAQSYNSGKTMDMNYAKVGKAIGNLNANALDITIDDQSTFSTAALPTSPKTFVSDTSAGSGNFYDFVRDQDLIGYSGVNKTISGETSRTFGTILIGLNIAKPQTGDALKAITYVHSKTFGKDDLNDGKNKLIYHFTAQ